MQIGLGLGRYWHRVSNSNRYSVVSNSIEYRPILSLYLVSMPINNKCTTSANFFLYLRRWNVTHSLYTLPPAVNLSMCDSKN